MPKREELAPNGDTRYVRRDPDGKIRTSAESGAALLADARHQAKQDTKPGEGDRGDLNKI